MFLSSRRDESSHERDENFIRESLAGESFSLPKLSIYFVSLFITTVLTLSVSTPVRAQAFLDSFRAGREYQTAIGLLRRNEFDLAERQFRKIIDRYGKTEYKSKAYFGLGETYYLQGQFDSATRNYYRSLTRGETLPTNLRNTAFRRGLESLRYTYDESLLDQYVAIIEALPREKRTSGVILQYVRTLDHYKRSDEALRWARRSIDLFNRSDTWVYQLSLLETRAGNLRKALPMLKKIKDTPRYRDHVSYLLGEVYYELSELEKAREHYRRVPGGSNYYTDSLYGLAWTFIKEQKYSRAKKLLHKVYDRGESLQLESARDLARIYRSQGSTEKSEKWYREAIKRASEPLQSKLRIEFANYLVKLDRLEEAVPVFESVDSLKLKSKKHLIRGYISQEKYDRALELIRENQSDTRLQGPRWEFYRSLAYYHTDRIDSASEHLPDSNEVSEKSLRVQVWRLQGRIHYDRGQFSSALETYRSWYESTKQAEPRYYTALMLDRRNKHDEARTIWQELVEKKVSEPWQTRAKFQLARLDYEQEKYDSYLSRMSEIDRSQLTRSLKLEMDIMKYAYGLMNQSPDKRNMKRARALLKNARKIGHVPYWFGRLLGVDLDKNWWNDLLVPVLLANQDVRKEWAEEILRTLRGQGKLKLSLGIGNRLLKREIDPKLRLDVQVEQISNLLELDRPADIGRFLPEKKNWSRLDKSQKETVGLGMAKYYRAKNQFKKGKQRLETFRESIQVHESLERLIDEWIASFEVNLNRYHKARNRLSSYSFENLEWSGRLNLAVASYYSGHTEESLKLLKRLHETWIDPPVQLYKYGFRFLRSQGKKAKLKSWTDSFRQQTRYSDTQYVKLMSENGRYWIHHGNPELGLSILEELEDKPVSQNLLIPVTYYQAIGRFNTGKLEKALDELEKLQTQFHLNNDWEYRVTRTEIETYLRQNDWKSAYDSWRRLNQMQRGGEIGTRLLSEEGLKASPEDFKYLLSNMTDRYPDQLPDSQRNFWWGRYHDVRGNVADAIRFYKKYLQGDDSVRTSQVRLQLARLYQSRDQTEKALEQFQQLHEETRETRYLRPIARLHESLGHYEEAERNFKSYLSQSQDQSPQVRYELAQVQLSRDKTNEAYENLHQSLKIASDTEPWVRKARIKFIKMAFNKGRLSDVREQITQLGSSREKQLFRAELARREQNYDKSRKILDSYLRKADTEANRELFLPTAVSVYERFNAHDTLTRIISKEPEKPEYQLIRLRSLLELDRASEARSLYNRIDTSVLVPAAKAMGDYEYNHSNWRSALGYYRESDTSIRTVFRIGKIQQKLGNYGKAFSKWEELLKRLDKKPMNRWVSPVLSGIRSTTYKNKKWLKSAKLIDLHWSLFSDRADTAAQLGLRWSYRGDADEKLTYRFLDRTDSVPPDLFVKMMRDSENKKNWDFINRVTNHVRSQNSGEFNQPHALRYYDLLAKHKLSSDSIDLKPIRSGLRKAVSDTSAFAPKLQRLLADELYKRGDYKDAAINYRKVEILFQENDEIPRARLGLARTYLNMNRKKKARNVFRKLANNSSDTSVQKEARKWLNQNEVSKN